MEKSHVKLHLCDFVWHLGETFTHTHTHREREKWTLNKCL